MSATPLAPQASDRKKATPSTAFIILTLLFCWPVGLILMWRQKGDGFFATRRGWKFAVSAIWALLVIIGLAVSGSGTGSSRKADESSQTASSQTTVDTETARRVARAKLATQTPSETAPPPPKKEPAEAERAISVTANRLVNEYKANEVAADEKFKGKMLLIEGLVDKIGKDILDTSYVALTSGAEFEFVGVQCFFAKKDNAMLAGLHKGQKVAIKGRCDGLMGNVLIKDSVLLRQ
jgi:hypothetical protein